jgi:hypothetical protein
MNQYIYFLSIGNEIYNYDSSMLLMKLLISMNESEQEKVKKILGK